MERSLTIRSINNFILGLALINIFLTLQAHYLPFICNIIPTAKIFSLSSWGLKKFLIFQPISFSLLHYSPVLDISYLTSLLFYIYILKKCADFFILHNKHSRFLFLYLVPTALSALIYIFIFKNQLSPIYSPYLCLTSIILSCTLLDPNKKILRPVHARPAHYGIPLKWATLAFIGYQLTLGSLSTAPFVYICLVNLITTYLMALFLLKSTSQSFFFNKLEKFLHRTIFFKKENHNTRIDRILDKISKSGMNSLSFLDRLYLKINNSHFS